MYYTYQLKKLLVGTPCGPADSLDTKPHNFLDIQTPQIICQSHKIGLVTIFHIAFLLWYSLSLFP